MKYLLILALANCLNAGVRLEWEDNSVNEVGFRIERGTSPSSYQLLAVTGVNSIAFEDTTVKPSTTYHYRVAAFSGAGVSSFATTSVTTPSELSQPKLVNLSAQAELSLLKRTAIVGFVLKGEGLKRVLIRGIGPGLSIFGVSDVASDPSIKLYKGSTLVDQNEDWILGSTPAPIMAEAARSVGAFVLQAESRDAALIAVLTEGDYTVHVSSNDLLGGTVLVEVYELKD